MNIILTKFNKKVPFTGVNKHFKSDFNAVLSAKFALGQLAIITVENLTHNISKTSHFIASNFLITTLLILCLLIPRPSYCNNQQLEAQNNNVATQHTTSGTTKTNQTHQKKKILTSNRSLGGFFAIGLIINIIMMTSFAIWAFGQWKQNSKKNKK
ncbi:MAG: hypothetical protein HN826_16610 [Methylococcales bacterium]|nr:hypothetical protein [Methylococcales bacterium]